MRTVASRLQYGAWNSNVQNFATAVVKNMRSRA